MNDIQQYIQYIQYIECFITINLPKHFFFDI